MNNTYVEALDRMGDDREMQELFEEIADCIEQALKQLDTGKIPVDEASGIITNFMSMGLVSKLKKETKAISSTKDIGRKIDAVGRQNALVGSIALVGVAVSGEAKGLLGKGTRILSLIKALRG